METATKQSVVKVDRDILVTADNPVEMQQCQQALVEWCVLKIQQIQQELAELTEAYDHAKKNKWATGALKRQCDLAKRRVQYYDKIKQALEQGYYIVPNFPVDVFAVRTSRNAPNPKVSVSSWRGNYSHQQKAQLLPAGDGGYRNSLPLVTEEKEIKVEGENKKTV